MAYSLTVSPKGQVTLPKELRDRLSLRPGDQLVYTLMEGGVIITPKSTDFNDLAGLLGKPPKSRATLELIDEAIAAEASESATAPLRSRKLNDAA